MRASLCILVAEAILAGILFVSHLALSTGEGNAVEFDILCTLYGMAKHIEKKPSPIPPELSKADKILQEMRFLQIEASEDNIFNFGDEEFNKEHPENTEEKKKLWQDQKKKLEAQIFLSERPRFFTRPPASAERKRVERRVRMAYEKARDIQSTMQGAVDQAGERLTEAKKKLAKGVFNQEEAKFEIGASGATTFTDSGSGRGCGNDGSSESGGHSLLSDLACICVGRGTGAAAHTAAVCYPEQTRTSTNVQAASGLVGATEWSGLLAKCGGVFNSDDPATPLSEGIRRELNAFRTQVGAAQMYKLGKTATNGQECTGDHSNAGNLCVSYKHNFKNGAGFGGISWYKDLKTAADKLEAADRLLQTLPADLRQMEFLNASAWNDFLDLLSQPDSQDTQTKTTKESGEATGLSGGPAQSAVIEKMAQNSAQIHALPSLVAILATLI